MAARGIPWEQSFPYRSGSVLVTRYGNGWGLSLGGQTVQSTTLVGAFESLRGRLSGDAELRVVLDALAHDRTTGPPPRS
jgi:hypothetical protein